MFEIAGFWTKRFAGAIRPLKSDLQGWSEPGESLVSFVEPTLSVREGDPEDAVIIIIAAPGAVGKTTLSRQIAQVCHLPYVDLAVSSPLGGNFFTGGLSNAFGLDSLSRAAAGTLGLIIDGLDEGQLRATPEGFSAGLLDLARITGSSGSLPAVLCGRSLAAEDAWLILSANGHRVCLLEIEFFDEDQAQRYLQQKLKTIAEGFSTTRPAITTAFTTHGPRFLALARETRARLASAEGENSARFTGYAPVLDAICFFVLDEEELNPQARLADLSGKTQVDLIKAISQAVLVREQSKLVEQLTQASPAEHHAQLRDLYGPEEQRAYITAHLFGGPKPESPQLATPDLSRKFAEMVTQFFPAHPFLDGMSRTAANVVFTADILVWALHTPAYQDAVRRGLKANPRLISGVLFDLYIENLAQRGTLAVPLSDVGILYDGMKSQIGARQRASLEVIQEEEDEAKVTIYFDVIDRDEIVDSDRSYGPYLATIDYELELRTPITNVFIEAPIWAALGDGSTLQIEAPTELKVETLSVSATQVFVQGTATDASDPTSTVMLLATEADVSSVQQVTVSGATLMVSWPGARQHPWTRYACEFAPPASPDLEFMRRRLRRILTAFRSHSRGMLARYAHKIDHLRMTKDRRGSFLVERLVTDGVLSTFEGGKFYQLHPDRMGNLLGIDYIGLQKHLLTLKCDSYLQSVLQALQ